MATRSSELLGKLPDLLAYIAEARAALADYKELFFADLASWERLVRRLFPDPTPLDHIAEGLRKAGFE